MARLSSSEIEIVDIRIEAWSLARPFVISRGAKTEARVVVVEIAAQGRIGRGESVPYSRYGETPETTVALLKQGWPLNRQALVEEMPAGAARNALDCALWDLEAKVNGKRVQELAGIAAPVATETCFTISVGAAETMAGEAARLTHLDLLKLKLDGQGDHERMSAVRSARPDCRLVADANESWSPSEVPRLLESAAENGFELIEQPLPAGADGLLAEIYRPVPICADESVHTGEDLSALTDRYDAVNIKLDKAGGLTEAHRMHAMARNLGFEIMIGSMVATSLAVAPAILLAHGARWVDLDGPMLLARDRPGGLTIRDGWISPPFPDLWG